MLFRTFWDVITLITAIIASDSHLMKYNICKFAIGISFIILFGGGGVYSLPRTKNPEAIEDGDIMLGALMMVHERQNEPLICGDVMPQGGVQAVEAMLFTLDWINRNHIIPHTKLGARILDDCDKDTYGLQQAVEFIKGKMGTLQSGYSCTYANSSVKVSVKPITGVVAASSSVTSIQVANLLKLFKIPQVSYFSTSAELGNRERYPYFFRTIPSDQWQVEAMKDIVLKFNWTYVSVVYEESSYGKVAMQSLEEKLKANNVCIAARLPLPKDSDVAQDTQYDSIVEKLLKKDKAKGVLVYGSDQEVQGLVRAVRRMGATGSFTFIGSDGWSARELVYEGGYEEEILGTVSIQPMAAPIANFKQYFEKLTVEKNKRNPWFYEMWQKEFKCRYPNTKSTGYDQNYTKVCTGEENKGLSNVYAYEQQLQFVSDATMVFAYALKDYFKLQCRNNRKCIQCYHFSNVTDMEHMCEINGTLLKEVIQKVNFTGLAGNQFKFDEDKADPAPVYRIIHFRTKQFMDKLTFDRLHGEQASVYPYEWVPVGTWSRNYDNLTFPLNFSALEFLAKDGRKRSKVPVSSCSEKCKPDEIRIVPHDGDKCCWTCAPCQNYQFKFSENQCLECPNGTLPNPSRLLCDPIPEEVVSFVSVYGIICITIAITGTLGTLVILVIFLKHHETPVVKASGRELSYVILFGLFLCFGVTPLTLLYPTEASCGSQRFLAGFCFTVVYAALLTKTNRIARIFKSGRRTIRRPNFISPESQLIICSGITSVQILLVGLWLNSYPPHVTNIYPTRPDNIKVCQETVSNRYFMAYAYPIFLCIVCTVYAYKTRKMPEAFNESHYIGAAVYTTCIIWLAFVPVYIVSKESTPIRVTSVCISTSLTALVVQFCLFWPKVYIIVFKPERNIRQSIMGPKSGSISKSLLPPSVSNTAVVANSTMNHLYRVDRSDSSCYSDDEFLQLSARRSEIQLPKVNVATQTILPEESLNFIDKIAKAQCPVSINNFSEVDFIDNDDAPTIYSNKATSLDCISADDVPL